MAKIMEFDVDYFEARVCITDDEQKIKYVRTYYHYKGNMTIHELIEHVYNLAIRYGVTEIQILSDRVGWKAYEQLTALSLRGDGSAISVVSYGFKPLLQKN